MQKLRRRSWAERRELVVALCTASAVAGLLHTVSFRRVLRIVDWWGQAADASDLSAEDERRILWAAQAATRRLLPERPCLTQALTAHVLLARRGASSTTLQIGVRRRPDGTLDAHAWLDREGTVVIGGNASPSTYSMLTPRTEGGEERS